MNETNTEERVYVDDDTVHKYGDIIKKNKRNYWITKRIFDFTASLAGIIVLFPVFVIIGLAIVIDDPKGGPIYTQIRVGRHGKKFKLYKFRTMFVGADQMLSDLFGKNEADGPAFKMKKDPRITRVGAFLRKTSLDELPQLFNVLRGEMSVVGPRPALPSEVDRYIEDYKVRLMVTPGLTCSWQVTPNRNDVPFEDWVEMDAQYIGERTFMNDMKLIFKTIGVIFRGEGR